MVARTPRVHSALNFFVKAILIYHRHSKTFELRQIFKGYLNPIWMKEQNGDNYITSTLTISTSA